MDRATLTASRALAQQVAQARVSAASDAAIVTAQVAAVEAAVPADLSDKLDEIGDLTTRVKKLEDESAQP